MGEKLQKLQSVTTRWPCNICRKKRKNIKKCIGKKCIAQTTGKKQQGLVPLHLLSILLKAAAAKYAFSKALDHNKIKHCKTCLFPTWLHFPTKSCFFLFSCIKLWWLRLPDLVYALVLSGLASDCGVREHLSADPPSSPEWEQRGPESDASWVRDRCAFFPQLNHQSE